eukprot:scaffold2664_cov267-Pinguiococcus_pyrenoidosus.AAC.12
MPRSRSLGHKNTYVDLYVSRSRASLAATAPARSAGSAAKKEELEAIPTCRKRVKAASSSAAQSLQDPKHDGTKGILKRRGSLQSSCEPRMETEETTERGAAGQDVLRAVSSSAKDKFVEVSIAHVMSKKEMGADEAPKSAAAAASVIQPLGQAQLDRFAPMWSVKEGPCLELVFRDLFYFPLLRGSSLRRSSTTFPQGFEDAQGFRQ